MEFRLGDRVLWVPKKKTAIIISLLEYYGEYSGQQRGMIGIVTEDTKEGYTIDASECVDFKPTCTGASENDSVGALEDWETWEGPGFPRNDYY